ncbi:hypothetical protein SAMN02745857_01432 [Andreprevotia lacus DSM 23236]|jgi:hypothetical protein|uniref:Carboxypeptidase regulatory-like domain-containing protein n=1 Tax=Andreprevotia lacus DSM 23236 TaxID=1121001 RepID=A0A1W1XGJ0_9NEIS|nr:hypothetical protein [Andreprevotia lacus]SMC22648.1 hypothetical protein SAMN02745857_01432 [Andreprevotia lacus DSM 23236]
MKKLVLLSFVFLVACDALTKVSGVVLDRFEKPLPGVKVWLIYNNGIEAEGITDSAGHFRLQTFHGPKSAVIFLATKEGKSFYLQEVGGAGTDVQLKVVLRDQQQSVLQLP